LIEAVSRVEGVRGIHIMSVGWEEVVPELAEAAGLLPRPTGDFPRPAAVGL